MSLLRRDRRVQLAAAIALAEWILLGALVLILEDDQRWWLGPILGAATFLQLALLLWRKTPNDPFSQAQQAFMAGEYAQTIHLLEAIIAASPDQWQAQTLLGNAYRQVGQLERSQATLQQVLATHPQADFPLYGLGRTLLAQADYTASAQLIEQALANGGRKAIKVDLALAYYLAGQAELALRTAKSAARQLQLEPYRVLMVNYLLRQLALDEAALTMMQRNAEVGLPYWQAEAQRFAHTGYGQQLAQAIGQMQAIIAKD